MPSNKVFIIVSYTLTWLVVLTYATRLALAGARARATFDAATSHTGGAN